MSRALLERLKHLVPATAEVVSLEWDHDGEDHNIAVFIDNGEDRQALEDRLLEAVMDYDEAHGTFTVCLVWPKEKQMLAGGMDKPLETDEAFWQMIQERQQSGRPTISHEELEASLAPMRTFMDRYLANEVGPDDIDDYVQAWHQGAGNHLTLSAYLGMTSDEYNTWLIDAGSLPHIREKRLQELSGDCR